MPTSIEGSAGDLADRIDQDVHTLRDLVSYTPDPSEPGRINSPQDAWRVVSSLVQVPGRLANVCDELARFLRQAAGAFAVDDDSDPHDRAVVAADQLEYVAGALKVPVTALHEAAKVLSHLKLGPPALEALLDVREPEQ